MSGAKSTTTPLCMTTPLKLNDGSTPADSKMFRSMVGALQYITLTRPDLSFAINKLSQFMHQPTQVHLQQLKRVLRYLKFTINHSLKLTKPTHL
jgi:histone deacetylase 1/2